MSRSFQQRLADLADEDPERVAVQCGEAQVTRLQLVSSARRLAHKLRGLGVAHGDLVTISLPNSTDWFAACAAAWFIGATPQPVSPRLPARELRAVLDVARPAAVVGMSPDVAETLLGTSRTAFVGCEALFVADDDGPLPEVISPAWKAPTSGGSTGTPKVIVSGDPAVFDPAAATRLKLNENGRLFMPAPLYHNGPGVWSWQQLLAGGSVVALERFDAEATLHAVEHSEADAVYLVPTMMRRILRLPDPIRSRYSWRSVRVVWHMAEPCPPWLKQAWIDWLGPERIWESYGGTEAQVTTNISGVEWLAHPGSVGQPKNGEIAIRDESGHDLRPGEIGEIWFRSARSTPTYQYIGATPRAMDGGWESIGDIGWTDADGYLYLSDRATDMIVVGGQNVYPAEVEAALLEHPQVKSAAVIGLPDDDRGSSIHAIIEAAPEGLDADALVAFAAERLERYKQPHSVEFINEPLRDDAGKVRRSELRSQRLKQS
ncbi:MAG: AMP-binding protein [Acidimicrobiia bacterium]